MSLVRVFLPNPLIEVMLLGLLLKDGNPLLALCSSLQSVGSGNLIKSLFFFWLLYVVCKTIVVAPCEQRHVAAMAVFILCLDFLCSMYQIPLWYLE